MSESTTGSQASNGFTSFTFALWMIAVLVFVWVEAILAPAFVPVFESLEVDLPGATVFFIDLGGLLRDPIVMSTVVILVVLSAMPVLRGRRDSALGKRYLKAAIALLLLTGFAFVSVALPIHKLQQKLGAEGTIHSSPR